MRTITTSNQISQREIENLKLVRKIAQEGIVLLENDGTLPLKKKAGNIALFGSGARKTMKGGSGSGDVNVRDFVTIEQGLLNAGFNVTNQNWLDEYDYRIASAQKNYDEEIHHMAEENTPQTALLYMMSHPFHLPETPEITAEIIEQTNTDTVIYVITRGSGEGADRENKPGDYQLTQKELSDLRILADKYHSCIVLLNICGPIDMSEMLLIEGINAIVNISMGGSSFGDAVTDVITGIVSPSGKMTATWAGDYEEYPCSKYNIDFVAEDDDNEIYYREGIYVGYRYFLTEKQKMIYPFGYGKSYTSFSIILDQIENKGEELFFNLHVKNTGHDYSGKEIVQIYVSIPNIEEKHPLLELKAFAKSKNLSPGEEQELIIKIQICDLAYYDESLGIFRMEQGEYRFFFGNSSDNLSLGGSLYFGDMRYPQTEAEHLETFVPKDDNWDQLTVQDLVKLCVGGARMNFNDFSVIGNAADTVPGAAGNTTNELFDKYMIPSITMADGPAGIRVNPKYYSKGDILLKDPGEDPIFGKILPDSLKTVDLEGADICYQYCTALPTSTMLAQTWNTDILMLAGEMVANEMSEMGIDLWLAPGMNIQRTPLGGRNFEYFSEDPYLSGKCAAAITTGVQKDGIHAVCIKHFAVNNQENNRNYCNSNVSERALREIYLKGFELCIKEAQPLSLMTGVNLINGIHAANNTRLLRDILREEWHYQGFVMTDWGTTSSFGVDLSTKKYGCSSAIQCIKAGNDLIMPGSNTDEEILLNAVAEGKLTKEELQWCAGHILNCIQLIKIPEKPKVPVYFHQEIRDGLFLIGLDFGGQGVDGREIVPGHATSNSYLMVGKNKALLIDSMGDIPGFRQYAEELAGVPVMLALSHGHCDHIVKISEFKEIWMHEADVELLSGAYSMPVYQDIPAMIHLLENNDSFDLGERSIQVVHVEGHTKGSLLFLDSKTKILISGDTIARRLLYGISGWTDMMQFVQSLIQISKLDFDGILSAHDRFILPKSHIGYLLNTILKFGKEEQRFKLLDFELIQTVSGNENECEYQDITVSADFEQELKNKLDDIEKIIRKNYK